MAYIETCWDLHDFSVNRMNDFWMSFWKFAEIKASRHPTKICIRASCDVFARLTFTYAVDESIPIDQFPKFFEEARLNWAENVLCGKDDDLMIRSINETTLDTPDKYSWGEMRQLVAEYANALKRAGLRKGDFMVCMLHYFSRPRLALTYHSHRQ